MSLNYFVFDGEDSQGYGVGISGSGTFDTPERDVESVAVPGRNGDLLIDNGRFLNIDVTYPAYIAESMPDKIRMFAALVQSKIGYKRLEDTYHPDEYRLAYYKGGLSLKVTPLNIGAEFDITFSCKPQRFLKSGEIPIVKTQNSMVYNPTRFESKPLLRVYGTGTLNINDQTVIVTTANEYTDIDCDLMEAYKGATNCNANLTLPNALFLKAGENQITMTGITRVEITPRWWTI